MSEKAIRISLGLHDRGILKKVLLIALIVVLTVSAMAAGAGIYNGKIVNHWVRKTLLSAIREKGLLMPAYIGGFD